MISREPKYPIREAAEKLGISVHTLRMYEKEGLIIPFQKESSHRLYSDADIDRLECIRKGINESKISIQGIKTMYSLIPCWAITKCSDQDQTNCDAFNGYHKPCWTVKHENNICADLDCKTCAVYTEFTNCNTIKEKIKNLISNKD